ncbi:MAG TPA: AraC family transcriptional regulator [Pseudomonas sp.]
MRKPGDSISRFSSTACSVTSKLDGHPYSIMRKRDDDPPPEDMLEIPCTDAFSIIVQLRDFVSHKLWSGKRLAYKGGHAKGSMAIAYLGDGIQCQHLTPYDNLCVSLPRTSLEGILFEEGAGGSVEFDCGPGTLDPVAYHLALAVLPALSTPGKVNQLFLDQVMLALSTHIGSHYGNVAPKHEAPKGLAAWQLRLAKEMLAEHITGGVSVTELAASCSLSRTYFTRAFKQSTGMSPHDWLLSRRVEKAKELMLRTSLSLSQIGLDCGFADQSHFSRVFQKKVGVSPSSWRRFQQADVRRAAPVLFDTVT